ncbi:Uncharacterized protein YjcR [Cohnella sp. OV330]|uniref:phage terminase small subunit n=1 Tax=Cohnella sp. OV330 TaxID=1855288 RepID=UPI0008F33A55|nr:phage terminase small subunit [Cohnella sp. OV330]SFB62661.1 Uncharacterized protein YjcR [Cohnella sp. OV330]
MSREKSPLREQAFKLWCEGNRTRKLSSIAKELGIQSSLVRKWKHIDNWEERPDPGPKRRGAPKGNKNAIGNKGGGAPERNKNALTHGQYETIWMDALEPEEQIRLMAVETDPIKQVENEIRLLELRERRMLKLRADIMNGWDDPDVVSKYEFIRKKFGEKPAFDEDGMLEFIPVMGFGPEEVDRTVKKTSKLERILAIEEALTRVQDKKAKLVDLLCKIEARMLGEEEQRVRIDKMKAELRILEAKEW